MANTYFNGTEVKGGSYLTQPVDLRIFTDAGMFERAVDELMESPDFFDIDLHYARVTHRKPKERQTLGQTAVDMILASQSGGIFRKLRFDEKPDER